MSQLRPRGRARKNPSQYRHGRLKRRHPWGFIAKLVATVASVVVISSLGVAGVAAADILGSLQKGIHLTALPGHSNQSIPPNVGAMPGGINLLLVGSDTRTGQGSQFDDLLNQEASAGAGNNDVTILLHVAANHKSATVVQFPRDMVLSIPSCTSPSGGTISSQYGAMLNTTYAEGGLDCVARTIEQLTGINDIPFAAEISFDGVAEMANAVGGVTVCVGTAINDPYTGLDLTAGEHTLSGYEALAFLRTRHGVGDGSDLGRISNQQVYLSALMRTITSDGKLSNPATLFSLAKAATSNMQLSDTLTKPTTLVQIAMALKSVPLANMTFVQYPVVTDPNNNNRVIPDTSGGSILDNALINDQQVFLTGGLGRGSETQSPNPTDTANPENPTDTTSTPPTSTENPTPTPTIPPGAVALPSDAPGQNALQQTCSKGQNG